MARFFVRLTHIKVLKLLVDRVALRERPFRDRDVSLTVILRNLCAVLGL